MTDTIKNTIKSLAMGLVFTAADFPLPVEKQKTNNKVLDKLVAAGQIRKLSKGRFYKPQMNELGEPPPDTYQVLKDLLEKDGKRIGYVTGYAAFNDLGLTTQVPAVIQIGTRKEKKRLVRDKYRVSFIKQENIITKENIPLLRLLDCLRFFKIIPDAMPDETCKRLLYLFSKLDEAQIATVKRLVLKYNPATIALLGAILEMLNPEEDTAALFKKLNPITVYKLYIPLKVLPNQRKWNIW
ncbi:MAG: DUF6088 family protein [Dysgonamonadaceae bacterium]